MRPCSDVNSSVSCCGELGHWWQTWEQPLNLLCLENVTSLVNVSPACLQGLPTPQVRKSSKQREQKKSETSGQRHLDRAMAALLRVFLGSRSTDPDQKGHLEWEESAPLGDPSSGRT